MPHLAFRIDGFSVESGGRYFVVLSGAIAGPGRHVQTAVAEGESCDSVAPDVLHQTEIPTKMVRLTGGLFKFQAISGSTVEIRCEHCDVAFSYDSVRPRFCQFCGRPLPDLDSQESAQGRGADERADGADWDDLPRAPTSELNMPTVPPVSKPMPGDHRNSDEGRVDKQPSATLHAGCMIGPYKLVRQLGSGGMGVVWEAVESASGRHVALKLLNREVNLEPASAQRFEREARLAAQISHPHVTFIFGAGHHEGQPYIAMELMPGKTLADELNESGPLPIQRAVDYTLDVIDGLIAAHRMGVIHRDIKPSNCFLEQDGRIKIGDFGLSKSMDKADVNLTQSGTFMGTPSYSAPEQVRGESLDARADIYSLGATLYCLLTGQPPFVGDAMSVTAQIVTDPPKPARARRPEIPADLDAAILRCLEKEPQKRFESLEKLRAALLPFASHGTLLSTFGRRLAAFMVDVLVVKSAFALIVMATAIGLVMTYDVSHVDFTFRVLPRIQVVLAVVNWLLMIVWFGWLEGRSGQGLGKRLMELKVVTRQGERPGYVRATIRGWFVPGCLGITLAWGIHSSLQGPATLETVDWLTGILQALTVYLLPTAIILSTMSPRNGFRGLHEIATGTRVLRLPPRRTRTLNIPRVEPLANTIRAQRFGPYLTHELLGRSDSIEIYLGHDMQLDRPVWIVTRPMDDVPQPERIRTSRRARPRWLAGGFTSDRRWDAFEAVQGVPLPILTGADYRLGWEPYRNLLRDLAHELKNAIEDGTLPKQLSMSQVWMDQDGSLKLIDFPLVNIVVENRPFDALPQSTVSDDDYRAVELLQQIAELLLNSKDIPLSGQEVLLELAGRLRDRETLEWAIEKFDELSNHMADLKWDSRLGVLGVSIGVEGLIYGLLTTTIFMLFLFWVPVSATWSFLAALICSSAIPAIMGCAVRSPVFRFMGIDLVNLNNRLASRWRCGFRNMVAWFPFMLLCGCLVAISGVAIAQMRGYDPPEGSFYDTMLKNPKLMWGIFAAFLISAAALAAGIVAAVLNPKRGIPEILTGTKLMPR